MNNTFELPSSTQLNKIYCLTFHLPHQSTYLSTNIRYLVDDNHLVESGSAVSIELTSAGSYLRQGLGFSWVYQRLHDVETKTPPTQLHMFVFQQQQQPLLASSSSSLLSSGLPESSISSSSSSGQSVLSSSSPTNNRCVDDCVFF